MTITEAFNFALENQKIGNFKKAESVYRKILQNDPNHLNTLTHLGRILFEQGKLEEVTEILKHIIEINPTEVESYKNLAVILKNQGRIEEAIEYCRKAISYDPLYIEAYYGIAMLRKFDSIDDQDLKSLLPFAEKTDLNDRDQALLHFALGKIYDNCKKYDKAFYHYHKANQIRKSSVSFNINNIKNFYNQAIRLFDKDFFKQKDLNGNTSELPVFIVGMPRSGTTLIEQILSSHPQISGAGELRAIPEISRNIMYKINNDNIAEKTEEYLKIIKSGIDDNILRVSDKMPYNFIHLGLIATLFPNAKIIHSVRNPIDTCLSNYFHFFANQNEHSYDLVNIAEFHKEYQRIMEHWKKTLPIKIHEVNYEDLVKDKEKESKALIKFVGLKWDDKCLEFHKNKRNVKTASAWQVRQPIYKTSVARWKNYEKYIPLLKEILEGKL